jgi:hypothetical protein
MMADIDEEDRYGLFGLLIGLQNKDLPLVTENLLKVRLIPQSVLLVGGQIAKFSTNRLL